LNKSQLECLQMFSNTTIKQVMQKHLSECVIWFLRMN